jgi:hypothetical protein
MKVIQRSLIGIMAYCCLTWPNLALAEPSVFSLVRCSTLAAYAGLKAESKLLKLAAIEHGIPHETRNKLQNKIITTLDEYYKGNSIQEKRLRIFIRYAGSCEPAISNAQELLRSKVVKG